MKKTHVCVDNFHRIKYVCEHCGGINIIKDAIAKWDAKIQCWKMTETTGELYCNDCNHNIKGIEVELD